MGKEEENEIIDMIKDQMIKCTNDFQLITKESINAFIDNRRQLTHSALKELIDLHPTGLTQEQSIYVQELNERSKVMIDILSALRGSMLKRLSEYKDLIKIQADGLKEDEYNVDKITKKWLHMMDEQIEIDRDIENITANITQKKLNKGNEDGT